MSKRPDRQVSVSFGVCLLLAWFGVVNGWPTLLAVLLASGAHEAGHIAALRLLGGKLLGFRLAIPGAVLSVDGRKLSYGRELACVLAGPAVNLLLAWLSVYIWKTPVFAGANISLCLFNLLPVRPLDGGRGVYLLLCAMAGPGAGERGARVISAATAAASGAGLVALMYATGGSLWLLMPAICFFVTFLRECQGKLAE